MSPAGNSIVWTLEAFPICSQFFSPSILGESFPFGVILRSSSLSVRRVGCSSYESLAKNESSMFPMGHGRLMLVPDLFPCPSCPIRESNTSCDLQSFICCDGQVPPS
jgi:hypothetical protein